MADKLQLKFGCRIQASLQKHCFLAVNHQQRPKGFSIIIHSMALPPTPGGAQRWRDMVIKICNANLHNDLSLVKLTVGHGKGNCDYQVLKLTFLF